MNELADTLRPLPDPIAKVARAVEHLADKVKTLRQETPRGTQGVRDDLSDLKKLLLQLAGGLALCLITGIIALIGALNRFKPRAIALIVA